MPEREKKTAREIATEMMTWGPEQFAQAYWTHDANPSLKDLISAAMAVAFVRGTRHTRKIDQAEPAPRQVGMAAQTFYEFQK